MNTQYNNSLPRKPQARRGRRTASWDNVGVDKQTDGGTDVRSIGKSVGSAC